MNDSIFDYVKVGDRVQRLIAERITMELVVVRVDDTLIWASLNSEINPDESPGWCWTFDRQTGIEEDRDLRWGVQFGRTGSRLVKVER